MTAILDPKVQPDAIRQNRLYYARRNHRANSVIGKLTAWAEGLVIPAAGYYVSVNGSALVSLGAGTTGSTKPSLTTTAIQNDGGVSWQWVTPKTFLTNPTPLTPA